MTGQAHLQVLEETAPTFVKKQDLQQKPSKCVFSGPNPLSFLGHYIGPVIGSQINEEKFKRKIPTARRPAAKKRGKIHF